MSVFTTSAHIRQAGRIELVCAACRMHGGAPGRTSRTDRRETACSPEEEHNNQTIFLNFGRESPSSPLPLSTTDQEAVMDTYSSDAHGRGEVGIGVARHVYGPASVHLLPCKIHHTGELPPSSSG